MRPYGTPKQLQGRRRRAIALLKTGATYRSVAQKLKCSLSSVVRWHQSWRKKGAAGLRPKLHAGRPARLSNIQKKKLINFLGQGALEAGYPTDVWTLKRIAQVIRRRFGVRYHQGHVWHLMIGLGWSCQKPSKRAKERREAQIRYWKRSVWPHIKKGRRAWSPFGLPG